MARARSSQLGKSFSTGTCPISAKKDGPNFWIFIFPKKIVNFYRIPCVGRGYFPKKKILVLKHRRQYWIFRINHNFIIRALRFEDSASARLYTIDSPWDHEQERGKNFIFILKAKQLIEVNQMEHRRNFSFLFFLFLFSHLADRNVSCNRVHDAEFVLFFFLFFSVFMFIIINYLPIIQLASKMKRNCFIIIIRC